MKMKKWHFMVIVSLLVIVMIIAAVMFVKRQFSAKELTIENMPAPSYASALLKDGKPEIMIDKGILYYTTPGSQDCTPLVIDAKYKSDHVTLHVRDCSGVTLFATPEMISKQAIYLPGYDGINDGSTISLEIH